MQNRETSVAERSIAYQADAILKSTLLPDFPLRGIAIGNGWIDPIQQYPGYVDFAYEKGLIKKGTPVSASSTGTISSEGKDMLRSELNLRAIQEADRAERALKTCQAEIDKWLDPATTPVNINNCGCFRALCARVS